MHTVIEESYKNINTIPLAVEVFTFKLPFGVDFQGNKLEKSMENLE